MGRVLVIIPTYNEAENVRIIVDRLRRAVPVADVLVADDNSPDGTGRIADELAAADSQIHVLHRAGKQGLGAAYLAGFAWASDRGYDAVVEMDADGSHAPEELPKLLDALANADAVLGSRWVPGGTVVNWPLHRHLISRGGNLYTRLALRHAVQGRHRRLPRLPDEGAGQDGRRRGRLAGLLLPGRPGLAGLPQRPPGGRGADHLRRAGARGAAR